MNKNNDLIALDKMARDNKKIFLLSISTNLKRANTGKDGWGEVVLAIPNETIMNLDNYVGGLYLADKEEFAEYKNKE
jgi:hypothetical protein